MAKKAKILPPLTGAPKIIEETSELCQALMKAAYTTPVADPEELMRDIEEEIADSLAAIEFFTDLHAVSNGRHLSWLRIQQRKAEKMAKLHRRFKEGDLNGLRETVQ